MLVYHERFICRNVHGSLTNMAGIVPDNPLKNCHLQLGCHLGLGKSRWVWEARSRDQQSVSMSANRSEPLINSLRSIWCAHVFRQILVTESLSISTTNLGTRPLPCISMESFKRGPLLWTVQQGSLSVRSHRVQPSPMTLL